MRHLSAAVLFNSALLFNISLAADIFFNLSTNTGPNESQVVFASKPFDYGVDLPQDLLDLSLGDLVKINTCFSQLPPSTLAFIAKEYFGMFAQLYPGLENVPCRANDLVGLIIFGLLLVKGHDSAFFPAAFILSISDLEVYFSNCAVIKQYMDLEDYSLFTKESALQMLFEWAVRQPCLYTVEAFFEAKIQAFSIENLLFNIISSKESGNCQLVNRIASKIDISCHQEVLATEIENCTWPLHEAPLLGLENYAIHHPDEGVSKFQILEELGKGTYARCLRIASEASGKFYALKCISKAKILEGAKRLTRLQREISLQRMLAHEGIIQLYHVTQNSTTIYMMMELCEGKSIASLIEKGPIDENYAAEMICQVVPALGHIHRCGIVHRDIKPENLLIKGRRIKIADFGFATFIPRAGDRTLSICGTILFVSPEILSQASYGFEVDIWSLGVSLYQMLAARYPFLTAKKSELIKKIVSGHFRFPLTPLLSDLVKSFIRLMLQTDPKKRITIDEMLLHSYLANRTDKFNASWLF